MKPFNACEPHVASDINETINGASREERAVAPFAVHVALLVPYAVGDINEASLAVKV